MESDPKFDFIYHCTKAHWLQWRLDYEHDGPAQEIPILNCASRLGVFCAEFNVKRHIPEEKWDTFCKALPDLIIPGCCDDFGGRIEALSDNHRMRDHTVHRRRITSLLSKIAMVIKPAVFLPIDKWAECGLQKIRKRPPDRHRYVDFMEQANLAWRDPTHEGTIKHYLSDGKFTQNSIERRPGFSKRMFDIYLMACGDRFGRENNPLFKSAT